MQSHVGSGDVQIQACSALANICAALTKRPGHADGLQRGPALGGCEAAGDAAGRGPMALDVLKTDSSESLLEGVKSIQ